jgi:uncharacterized protein DUF4170
MQSPKDPALETSNERARRGRQFTFQARSLAPQCYPVRPFTAVATAVRATPEQKGDVDPSKQSVKALHGRTASKPPRTPDGKLMTTNGKQLLHFVFGGELKDLSGTEFRDLSKLDIVGIFPDYASAAQAWKAKAQATVDNAHMRYFVAHLHRLLDPSKDKT